MAGLYGRARGSRLSQAWRSATERFRKRSGRTVCPLRVERVDFRLFVYQNPETFTLERAILEISTSSVWSAKHLIAQGMARNTRWQRVKTQKVLPSPPFRPTQEVF